MKVKTLMNGISALINENARAPSSLPPSENQKRSQVCTGVTMLALSPKISQPQNCLLFKPPSLWYFAIALWAKSIHKSMVYLLFDNWPFWLCLIDQNSRWQEIWATPWPPNRNVYSNPLGYRSHCYNTYNIFNKYFCLHDINNRNLTTFQSNVLHLDCKTFLGRR